MTLSESASSTYRSATCRLLLSSILVSILLSILCVVSPASAASSTCGPPALDARSIAAFVHADCFADWQQQPAHLSGAEVDGEFFTVHQDIEVFYSSGVGSWLAGHTPSIADGEMIVGLVRPHGEPQVKPTEAVVKIRALGSSVDGWFWSTVPLVGDRSPSGQFGNSTCMSCHASASQESTYLAADGPVDAAGWRPDPAFVFPDPPPVGRRLPKPLKRPDADFVETFGLPTSLATPKPYPARSTDHVAASVANRFLTSDQCRGCHNAGQRLSGSRPNMWYPDPAKDPDDDPVFRNYSPYGEWSASIHSLAARDPVWHAEVEAEVATHPELESYIVDTCFSCHGPMAGRQLQDDTGDPTARFTSSMFWADRPSQPGSLYGALARDGVSCAVCHRMSGDLLGVDLALAPGAEQIVASDDPFDPHRGYRLFVRPNSTAPYTGRFVTDTSGSIFGPHDEVNGLTMQRATGFEPVGGEPAAHLGEASLCGSCHLIIVPSVPEGYQGDDPGSDPTLERVFEQTTYWEWRNSFWENEASSSGLPCQGCHMAPHRGRDGRLLSERIANIESDRFPPTAARLADDQIHLAEQFPYPRHVFLGINLFVLEMFAQFPDLLGSTLEDTSVPERTLEPLLNASDWMANHAERDSVLTNVTRVEAVEHDGHEALEIDVQVANYAGHKFPTGAAIRRAFIELTVLDDAGKVLWSSGTTNKLGVIVDGASGDELASEWTDEPALSQPHHLLIDRQDQVQIYEERTLDEHGKLQSSVLGIAGEYKDNRIVPAGWVTEARAGGGVFQTDRRFPNPGSINMFAIHPRLPLAQPAPVPALGVKGTPVPGYCADAEAGLGYDPYYCDPEFTQFGADITTYRVPIDEIDGWACVQARILYQSLPPYFLKERLNADGGTLPPAAERLAYIASRLDWQDSAVDNWSLQVGTLSSADRDGLIEHQPVLRQCGEGDPAAPVDSYARRIEAGITDPPTAVSINSARKTP